MEDYLEIMENPTHYYSKQRGVMKRAAKLRREGYDSSTALSMAWGNENPESGATVVPSTFTWLLLGVGGFILVWYLVKKEFPWASLGRPKIRRAVPLPTNQHREVPYSMIVP